jgi:hypothetical protein
VKAAGNFDNENVANKKRIHHNRAQLESAAKQMIMLQLNQSLIKKIMEMEQNYDDKFTVVFEILEKIVEMRPGENKNEDTQPMGFSV